MTARPAAQLPDRRRSDGYAFEPKLDGWRCLAFHRIGGEVALQSRHHKPLISYFPEIAAAVLEQLPAGTVLDGELVAYRDGRCDFVALQRRIFARPGPARTASSAAHAAGSAGVSFVVFDAVALAGRDLRGLPYRKRRKRLRRLLAECAPPLLLMPATRELAGAHAWLRDHADAGVEGVVVKHREHGYRPRRRSWKVRTYLTVDAVVGGVIGPLTAPEALLLGLPDKHGRLRVAGRTGPLTLPARREIGALLMPPQRAHPWPERIPSSRFGQRPGDLTDYTPTEPLLIVEVDADVCFEHDRWRHPTGFRRIRADLQTWDL
jgi:ATP-dependent DNA ligase